jgi:hypothetical protein
VRNRRRLSAGSPIPQNIFRYTTVHPKSLHLHPWTLTLDPRVGVSSCAVPWWAGTKTFQNSNRCQILATEPRHNGRNSKRTVTMSSHTVCVRSFFGSATCVLLRGWSCGRSKAGWWRLLHGAALTRIAQREVIHTRVKQAPFRSLRVRRLRLERPLAWWPAVGIQGSGPEIAQRPRERIQPADHG